jgi:putative transposase
MQLSKFVNNLKTVSSIYVRKEFPAEVQQFYWKPVFWHSAYFIASCGGVTVDVLKRYVQEQDSPADVEDPVGNSSRP